MFACLARMLQVLQLLYCPDHCCSLLMTEGWGGSRSAGALNVLQGLPAIGYFF
uniref:Uncharacterized protein n=1 Tax=Anguilla anguilla TaxID=7936 RepID=A0A0E9WSF5_ANGAN